MSDFFNSTCIVSGLRLYYLSQLSYTDVTFGIPNALIFSALEPGVGITLACIPFLRPLLGRSQYSQKGTAQYYTTAEGRSGNSARPERYRGFTMVDETSSQYPLRQYGQQQDDTVPELPTKALMTSQATRSTRDSY